MYFLKSLCNRPNWVCKNRTPHRTLYNIISVLFLYIQNDTLFENSVFDHVFFHVFFFFVKTILHCGCAPGSDVVCASFHAGSIGVYSFKRYYKICSTGLEATDCLIECTEISLKSILVQLRIQLLFTRLPAVDHPFLELYHSISVCQHSQLS